MTITHRALLLLLLCLAPLAFSAGCQGPSIAPEQRLETAEAEAKAQHFATLGSIAATRTAIALTEPPAAATLLPTEPLPTSAPTITPTPDPFPTRVKGNIYVAEQRFEGGWMFWLQPNRQIWLLSADAAGAKIWSVYDDSFVDGQAESDPNIIPPANRYQPVRGFGKLWRENLEVRQTPGLGAGWRDRAYHQVRISPGRPCQQRECLCAPAPASIVCAAPAAIHSSSTKTASPGPAPANRRRVYKMQHLRRQSIAADQAFEFHIAADARISKTDYCDDQAWRPRLGKRDEAALALQTEFGGRAGLASLVPMLRFGDRLIYQPQFFAQQPVITAFAPSFMQIDSMPLPELEMQTRFLALESHASGGEFTLRNLGGEALEFQFELFGHVIINGRKMKLNVLTMADYSLALHLGQIGNINPVATLEGARFEVYGGRIKSPKLGLPLALAPGETKRIQFVVAGLPDMRDSYSVAMNWLSRPWTQYFERIDRAAKSLPKFHTGKQDWDLLLDLSYAQLVKAFMDPSEHLPHASLVANRASNRGWSRRGDGSDHIRAWSGQDPTDAWLAVSAIAAVDQDLAKAVIRNYLSTQDEKGRIDRQPGLGGQRQGLLQMPILARLCQGLVELWDDSDFAGEVLPGLLAFFDAWLRADADNDGLPEWQSERQLGYIALPTFGARMAWAQGADIRQMETPDLLAYLISEADALMRLAERIGDETAAARMAEKLAELEAHLDSLWDGERYAYRDRDTHLTTPGLQLLQRGAGDHEHQIGKTLPAPARIMIRVVGGVSHAPRISMTLEGKDAQGKAIAIEAPVEDFRWHNRQGVYITQAPLSHVERIAIRGLSRVYKVYASAIDSSKLDINALLPLWTGRLAPERARKLVDLALDESHFLRPKGITMVSARDRNYDPSNARGGGGIWLYWLSLVCQGMQRAGYAHKAALVLERVLDMQARTLKREGKLAQFYHADEAKSFGEDHHIAGIAPLALLHDVIGIRIIAPDKTWVGGPFGWREPISVEQHGVTVRRSAN